MKKTAKSVLLMILMAVLMFALTGCGNESGKKDDDKKEASNGGSSANKLVATKDATDEFFGEHKEIIEVTFDSNDKAEKIEFAYEFPDEEKAKGIASLFALASSSEEFEGIETRQEGKRFIMSMNPKAFAEQQDYDEEELSRESLKTTLESEGYTVE